MAMGELSPNTRVLTRLDFRKFTGIKLLHLNHFFI
jgi:hypothetical protein